MPKAGAGATRPGVYTEVVGSMTMGALYDLGADSAES